MNWPGREWLLDHVPDWYLKRVWYPIWTRAEGRKMKKKLDFRARNH